MPRCKAWRCLYSSGVWCPRECLDIERRSSPTAESTCVASLSLAKTFPSDVGGFEHFGTERTNRETNTEGSRMWMSSDSEKRLEHMETRVLILSYLLNVGADSGVYWPERLGSPINGRNLRLETIADIVGSIRVGVQTWKLNSQTRSIHLKRLGRNKNM